MEDSDAQLQLKKRARRRLVGAVAFVSVVAVVLPMLMDGEPRQYVQDIDIRIPGQDERPVLARAPVAEPAAETARGHEKPPEQPGATPPEPPLSRPNPGAVVLSATSQASASPAPEKPAAEKPVEKSPEKPVEKPKEKPADKPVAKPDKKPEKPAEKPVEKSAEKPRAEGDSARAAAILSGVASYPPPASAASPKQGGGEYVIQIGAFSNEENVRQVRGKLSDAGVKSYTEALDSAQGKKIRVRAGPFASRDAAEKALEKMKRAGLSGTLTAK